MMQERLPVPPSAPEMTIKSALPLPHRRQWFPHRFRHQLHADFARGFYVLQVEDELRQVFDGVNVVMGRGNQ